jgi:hypothetical protein
LQVKQSQISSRNEELIRSVSFCLSDSKHWTRNIIEKP